MLGKGLESLIPQKGSGNGGQDDPVSRPPAFLPANDPASIAVPVEESVFMPSQPVEEPSRPAASPKEGVVDSVFNIEVEHITPNPDQPRRNFDEAALRDLAHSIREFGFLQPLVVSRLEKETPNGIEIRYQLIAGERRFLAAKMLGLHSVPAIVRKIDLEREKLELAVIENIQREGLNPIETARAFQRLQEEFRMTQREIAAKLGKSREVVANTVRLLDLPEYLQTAVQKGEISESNARFLLAIEDPGAQQRLFEDIVKNGLTTRDVRDRVRQAGGVRRGRPPKSEEHLPPELKAMQESLSMDLGAPVTIHKGASNGKITITFYSEEELENIMRRLGKES
jgi:ParB family chromosome partitioning protein